MSSERLENSFRRAADRLLLALKKHGPQTVAELGCLTEVCGEAVRQQLQRLADEGLVVATDRRGGVGRPAQVWTLTPTGNACFPDGHAEFASDLLRLIRSELGEENLDRLIKARAAERRAIYQAEMAGARGLGAKVQKLAEARTREGYMAECIKVADGFLLVENHCPVGVATLGCQTYCQTELSMMQALFEPEADVQWTEHISQGDRRCAYRITPRRRSGRRVAAKASASRRKRAGRSTN